MAEMMEAIREAVNKFVPFVELEPTSLEGYLARASRQLTDLLGVKVEITVTPTSGEGDKWREPTTVSGSGYITEAQFCAYAPAQNYSGKRAFAFFRLNQLHGCCGVLVSNGACVNETHQNKGVGTILAKLRIDLAKHFGYATLLCTDIVNNVPQRRILDKLGWKHVHEFQNPRSGNQVAVSILDLTK